MSTIAILIGTQAGARLLAAASEREAALSAEAFLLRLPVRALPAPALGAVRRPGGQRPPHRLPERPAGRAGARARPEPGLRPGAEDRR
uniref:hypothetical protein n=1 Tax=Methylobacterium sp. B34 TaxID=95563 RepID=UPI00034C65A7|nr:hypothetical protein [Methylobacterium sp. B34]